MAILSRINVVLLVIALSARNVHCTEPKVNEVCLLLESKLHCYTLYGSNTSLITWDTANDECDKDGGQLVMIKSQTIQEKLVQVIQPIGNTSGTVHVWTAGKRSNDTNWYYVNNTKVSQDVIDKLGNGSPGDRCAYIEDTSKSGQFGVGKCNDYRKTALCQSPVPCELNDISYNGYCYHLYHDQQQMDWNRARQYCREKEGRDLAYLHITDKNLLMHLNSTNGIWIGLSSRTWIWMESEMRMEYTKFRGGGESTGSCLYIDPNDEGKWDTDDCEDKNKYFICESTKATTASITTATTASITTTTTTIDSFTSDSRNESDAPKNDNSRNLLSQDYIIIYSVIGGLVLIIATVVFAVCVRRRKTSPGNDNGTLASYGSHIEASSDRRATSHGQGYTAGNNYSVLPVVQSTPISGSDYSEIPGNTPTPVSGSAPPPVSGSDYSEIPGNTLNPASGNTYSNLPGSLHMPTANNQASPVPENQQPVTSSEVHNDEASNSHRSGVPTGYKMSPEGNLYAVPNKGKTAFNL